MKSIIILALLIVALVVSGCAPEVEVEATATPPKLPYLERVPLPPRWQKNADTSGFVTTELLIYEDHARGMVVYIVPDTGIAVVAAP